MSVVVYISWICLAVLFATVPSVSLLAYGFVGADRDGYAIAQLLSSFNSEHKLITRGIFVGLFCFSVFKWISLADRCSREIKKIMFFVLLLSGYVFLGSLVKTGDFIRSLSALVYTGLPVCFSWIVFSCAGRKSNQFYGYVFLQIGLATLVLLFPSLDFLNGANYKALEGISVVDDFGMNSSVPDASFEKGQVGRYSIFHNPNALGFYSCASIAVGLSILRVGKIGFLKVGLSIAFCIMGGVGWLNSLTRAPMLLLAFGLALVSFFLRGRMPLSKSLRQIIVVFLVVTICAFVAVSTNFIDYMFPDSSNISVTTRFDGYLIGYTAVLRYPVFGVDDNWIWPELGYPHVLPLAFAADYGVIAGLLIFVIVFQYGAKILAYAISNRGIGSVSARDNGHAILYVMVVWGAALSNNLISPVLFWLLFAEAAVSIFGVHDNAA